MASPPPTAGSTSSPPSPATRVPTERSAPARVAAESSRRGAAEERGACPTSRHDGGSRSGDGDATNNSGGGSRGARNEEIEEGGRSEDDGDNEESKVDPERARRGPLTSDEFALISVPLDTWVGRYVRITTPRHNGTTGLVYKTGNGWVNLQTALGDVAKRAYDLVVIPEERANINGGSNGLEKGESRGKRYRAKAPASASIGSTSGSGDERKAAASRNRNTRTSAPPAHSSSDSSGQDDHDDDGDEHDNGRSIRRRGRALMDDCSEFEDAEQGDDEDDDQDNDDQRYHDDGRMRNNGRGGRSFPGSNGKGRGITKGGGREKGDRYGGSESMKQSGRMTGKCGGRDAGTGKPRGRVGEHEKMRERERGRGEPSKGGGGRDRDGIKGDSFVPLGKGRERDSDAGSSRGKRRDLANPLASLGDSEDKMSSSSRDRVDRSKDKPGAPGAGKKDDAAIKASWVTQMQKAKERPNLVLWRDELVAITKDSSEDFEDATLSVELMRARCDVCYHEKADGDKFCWNDQCWMSPVFTGYFKSRENNAAPVETHAPQRVGYVNTFGRETIIDSALTSSLQAPVKWIETKRKRELEAHEVFSEDPALYRWQCWASNYKDPNSKDPTFVEDPRHRSSDGKRAKHSSGHSRSMSASRLSPESKRFRAYDDKRDAGELDEMDIGPPRSGGGGGGIMGEASGSHKVGHAGDNDSRVPAYVNEEGRAMESGGDGDDSVRMDEDDAGHSVSRRGDVRSGRLWT